MAKKIIVNITPEETRMAVFENEEFIEVSIERTRSGHNVGNIYKGKTKNVLPGMQAAFIDIGREKNAFLYIGDTLPQVAAQAIADSALTVGKDVMIQIVKDAIGTKGPRATTHLTLPGRYVVLMPTVDYIATSRRIANEEERVRLKQIVEKVRPEGMGVIVRTMSEGKSEEDLQKDIEYLYNLWKALIARGKRATAPILLYRDVDLVIRIVRDYLSDDVEEFVLDHQEAYGRVCDLLKYASPELVSRVRLYQGKEDIFTHYGLDEELNKLGQRSVWLKCGGYIVIDKTEALTVIDVNTGKFVGSINLSDTVFQTNLEAASEIVRQIRLRDIGGIIIVDFIDMDKEEQKQAVVAALEEKFKRDRTKTNVLGFTGLGLVEITRKKARQNVEGVLYSECPCCEGRGRVQSPETVVINIWRKMRHVMSQSRRQGRIVIQVHPLVAEIIKSQGELPRMEQELACSLRIESLAEMHPEMFSLLHEGE
ncbi:Rne/Rng family ribonuclease [Pelosinus sp. UFO1]|uniref:Rne/Rng family ribonuclease n=1 Tax=Pelosinus sp. UFO1 TaxID=484770 RepID=UPI0004D1880B|nr:Rne/Rng family ribonuclease [Pelosinus sp. UFO1]AIF52475.1 ribonuclease, Rne/Rng family [Pelosinus sp. UFO1]